MIDGALDVKNLKVGDKITDEEECVAMLRIAVIRCKGSDALEPFPEFNLSKGFKFKDIIR